MKISYKWLKNYIDIDIEPARLSEILTNIGLEVEGISTFESIKGGLRGFVIGRVITCDKHSNANSLSVTTVDVGEPDLLKIVCGAPNVAAGQNVIVAPVGTTIYTEDDSFKIKKSKIRGEVSEGMICAEDELGLGKGHDGIMVLEDDIKAGIPAKDYFKVSDDIIFDIGLTPNRIDGASHYGVARDLAAYFSQDHKVKLEKPYVNNFKVDNDNRHIDVIIENEEACHRYSGLTISGIEVKESPEWLKNYLLSIDLKPINNVVDITNFVLHEIGQPLHAFDADYIKENKVIVKTLSKGTSFTTLDEEERKLDANDLMICNESEGMCIAGVFGGAKSGVTNNTKDIFLESAYFNPVYVRKTARRHGLNTDASFRFERGVDPNITVYALKRAALLIKELAGGNISSNIVDIYPNPVKNFKIDITFANINRLIGNEIDKESIKHILTSLEIQISKEDDKGLTVLVPPYRVDVKREADIIEEILRIYGYNYVAITGHVNSTITHSPKPDENKLRNVIAELLSNNGFNEIMANSLTKASYYDDNNIYKNEHLVKIYNPLSQDLNSMRQSLLYGGLEAIAYNINRKNQDLKLYEFGKCYFYNKDVDDNNPIKKYYEEQHFSIFISGNKNVESWNTKQESISFYDLKANIELVLKRLGFDFSKIESEEFSNDIFSLALRLKYNNKIIVEYGIVSAKQLKTSDINQEVFYGDLYWDNIFRSLKKHKVQFEELAKFPAVKRDLALIVDKKVKFEDIRKLASKAEKKLIRKISIFDVFEGKNIPEGKKSYAVSFIIQDMTKTLNDKYIERIMSKLIKTYEKELGAEIRK